MIKTCLKVTFSKRKKLPQCNTSCQKILTNITYKADKGRETNFLKSLHITYIILKRLRKYG